MSVKERRSYPMVMEQIVRRDPCVPSPPASDPLRLEHSEASVLDLKAHYRGLKYLRETLKILLQKPDTIVIEQIAERLGSIGAIHYTSSQIRPG